MNKFRKFGAALTLASFVATGMIASSARLQAWDSAPSAGTLCTLAKKVLDAASAYEGTKLYAYLLAQYNSRCN